MVVFAGFYIHFAIKIQGKSGKGVSTLRNRYFRASENQLISVRTEPDLHPTFSENFHIKGNSITENYFHFN